MREGMWEGEKESDLCRLVRADSGSEFARA